MSGIDAGMGENTGRTVGRKSIVKLGLIREGVDFADVVKKEAPRIGGLSADSVQINVLWRILSVVGPYPDQITLVRNNIKQFVLLKETGDRRVAFVPLSARLDGDRYEVFLAKSEAQHDVSNRFAHSVRGDHVHRVECFEVECLGVIARRKVRLGSVIEVPNAVNRHQIAIARGLGKPAVLSSPVPVPRRTSRRPPNHEQQENCKKNKKRTPSLDRKEIPTQHHQSEEREHGGHKLADRRARQIGIVNGERGPYGQCHDHNCSQRHESNTNGTHGRLIANADVYDNRVFRKSKRGRMQSCRCEVVEVW